MSKCKRTENIHAEHLKYATSVGTVFEVCFVPDRTGVDASASTNSMAYTSNTCLHTRGLGSLGKKAREVSKIATLSKIISAWNWCS